MTLNSRRVVTARASRGGRSIRCGWSLHAVHNSIGSSDPIFRGLSRRKYPRNSSEHADVYLLDLDINGDPGNIRRLTRVEGQHGPTRLLTSRIATLCSQLL